MSKKYFIDNMTLLKFFAKMTEWSKKQKAIEMMGLADSSKRKKYKPALTNFYRFKNEKVKPGDYFECNPCYCLEIDPREIVLKKTSEVMVDNFKEDAINQIYDLKRLKEFMENFKIQIDEELERNNEKFKKEEAERQRILEIQKEQNERLRKEQLRA